MDPTVSITDLLERAAARHGDAPAIRTAEGRTGWAGLAALSGQVATGLAAAGIGRGDRVALWLGNGLPWLALHLACARLGAVTVAVNTRFRGAEVGDILHRSGAVALALASDPSPVDFLALLDGIAAGDLAGLRRLILVGPARPSPGAMAPIAYAELAAARGAAPAAAPADAPHVVFATSGTTAAPKFALHQQGRAARHGADVARALGLAEPDTAMLIALPLCGVFAYAQLLGGLASATSLVIPDGFDAAATARLIRDQRVTTMALTDDMLNRVLQAADAEGLGSRPLPSLRRVAYAQFNTTLAGLPETATARGVPLRGAFGMTELYALFALRRDDAAPESRHLAGGHPVSAGGEARIVDPDGGGPLPDGEAGLLQVRSPTMMLRYDGDPDATRAAVDGDGWFATGDLARLDGDDGFTFLGRRGDLLRLSGFLVNPLEIESRIRQLSGIDGAQVVEVGTAAGNRPVAFVTLAPGAALDEAAAIAHCRAGLAAFKAPLRVIAVPDFPVVRGANGVKIQRATLRRWAEERLAAAG